MSWVKSVVCCGSNFQLVGAEILQQPVISAFDLIAHLFNGKSETVLKCVQKDFKAVGVYAWKVVINNSVAAENNTEVREETPDAS